MTPLFTRLLVLTLLALSGCNSTRAPAAHSPAPPNAVPAPAGKRAPCTLGADQTCNDDPKVSSLWGRCTEFGVCECRTGFELSPLSKRCRPAP